MARIHAHACLCCLDYIEAHADATRRLRRGERQRFCTGCSLWRWDDQPCCEGKRRLTEREFKRIVRETRPKPTSGP